MTPEFEKVDKFWKGWWRAARKNPVKAVLYVVVIVAGIGLTSFIVEKGRQFADHESNQADPLDLPIASATATVEVFIKSDKEISMLHAYQGGYLTFVCGSTPLLVAAASKSIEKHTGDGRVMFKGEFKMDSSDPAAGKPIRSLRKSEYAQVSFSKLPPDSNILGGKAVIVINGNFRFEFSIPPQKVTGEKIRVPDVGQFVEAP